MLALFLGNNKILKFFTFLSFTELKRNCASLQIFVEIYLQISILALANIQQVP